MQRLEKELENGWDGERLKRHGSSILEVVVSDLSPFLGVPAGNDDSCHQVFSISVTHLLKRLAAVCTSGGSFSSMLDDEESHREDSVRPFSPSGPNSFQTLALPLPTSTCGNQADK